MSRRKVSTQNEVDSVGLNHKLPTVIKKVNFRTLNQKRFYTAIGRDDSNIIMGHALAGAGKTYISIQRGLEMLLHKSSNIKKLIILNPTVDVGNEDKLGHLPGDLMEKMKVHYESSIFILHKIIGEVETNKLIERGKIEFMVLNFLRGRNFEDAYIILDEAQNASPSQMKTLVTRISDTTKLIIEGDLSQCDKYRTNGTSAYEKSGFYDIWKRLGGISGVYQIEFSKDDCIRSGIVKRILEKYEEEEKIELGECNIKPLNVDYSIYESNLIEYPHLEDIVMT
jgi:phosphate starvation-inducible protein PhoH and related proteins